ncbi:hypothetical protein ZZ1p0022 [Acinetobacter phage ZZ1]|jgi:hypothetical protein|uniref:Uncharacterized protein n=3 Tax=Caudoviricetes TaxID=2731619 RepID=A0A410T616_9CAUD|nr:hypothetical protein ZZ1p0022 [Acinetobacter phage ZZ1]AFL47610.1 hypothetical protein ZZ1p0022 [Acinetobacter phage ZZ1]QAU04066.1 hypothetical protein Henu6_gp83 [Acinetobacter phage Henu6]
MIYVNQKAVQDIIDFAENALENPNVVLNINPRVNTHNSAKWVIAKLKSIQVQMKALSEITNSEITYPLTEGTISNITMIKELLSGKANEGDV